MRMVSDVALPAHIASQMASVDTIATINGSAATRVVEATRCLIAEWELRTGLPPPEASRQRYQRDWDRAAATAISEQLLKDSTTETDRARLRAAAQPHSGAWLNAFPTASVGTVLNPGTLRTAVALRVGADICVAHRCRCGTTIDERGLHGLSCQLSAGRFPRHAELNSVIKRGLAAAGMPSVLEPAGLDRGDGRRPDGITTFPYAEGKCLVWDATCVDTFSASSVSASAARASAAATVAEGRKRRRYADISRRYLFRPVAVETSGALGPDSHSFLKELGQRIAETTGDRRDRERLMQRISVAVVRGNATAVLLATDCEMPKSATSIASERTDTMISVTGRMVTEESEDRQVEMATGLKENQLQLPAQMPTGLENLGNSCYMNAVVQCIYNTSDLRSFLLDQLRTSINQDGQLSDGEVSKKLATAIAII